MSRPLPVSYENGDLKLMVGFYRDRQAVSIRRRHEQSGAKEPPVVRAIRCLFLVSGWCRDMTSRRKISEPMTSPLVQ